MNSIFKHARVDDKSPPLQKPQFGFDLGHAPNFKDVPLCLKPESIIGHLKSAGWQEHLEPGLPNRQPLDTQTPNASAHVATHHSPSPLTANQIAAFAHEAIAISSQTLTPQTKGLN